MTGAHHLGDRGARRRRSRSATAAQSVVGGRRSRGDGRHHVDLWRTFFWHVLATYTRRSGHDIFVLMDQTERF